MMYNNLIIPSSEIPERDQTVRHTRVSPAHKGRLAQQTLKEMNRRGTSEKRKARHYRLHMHNLLKVNNNYRNKQDTEINHTFSQ